MESRTAWEARKLDILTSRGALRLLAGGEPRIEMMPSLACHLKSHGLYVITRHTVPGLRRIHYGVELSEVVRDGSLRLAAGDTFSSVHWFFYIIPDLKTAGEFEFRTGSMGDLMGKNGCNISDVTFEFEHRLFPNRDESLATYQAQALWVSLTRADTNPSLDVLTSGAIAAGYTRQIGNVIDSMQDLTVNPAPLSWHEWLSLWS